VVEKLQDKANVISVKSVGEDKQYTFDCSPQEADKLLEE